MCACMCEHNNNHVSDLVPAAIADLRLVVCLPVCRFNSHYMHLLPFAFGA